MSACRTRANATFRPLCSTTTEPCCFLCGVAGVAREHKPPTLLYGAGTIYRLSRLEPKRSIAITGSRIHLLDAGHFA